MRKPLGAANVLLILSLGIVLSAMVAGAYQLALLSLQRSQERWHGALALEDTFANLLEAPRHEGTSIAASARRGKVSIYRRLMLAEPAGLLSGTLWASRGFIDFSSLLMSAQPCPEACQIPRPQSSARWSSRCCNSLPRDGRALGNLVLSTHSLGDTESIVASGAVLIGELTLNAPTFIAAGGVVQIGNIHSAAPVTITIASASSPVEVQGLGSSVSLIEVTPRGVSGDENKEHVMPPFISAEILALRG